MEQNKETQETHSHHPDVQAVLEQLRYDHLPPHLQEVSKPLHDVGHAAASSTPYHRELVKGLDRLLEAKDCFVRAVVSTRKPGV